MQPLLASKHNGTFWYTLCHMILSIFLQIYKNHRCMQTSCCLLNKWEIIQKNVKKIYIYIESVSNGLHGVSVCCGTKRPIISFKNSIQCSGWFWYLKVNTMCFNIFNTLTLSYLLLKSHVDWRLFILLSLMLPSSVNNANLFHTHLIPPSVIYKPKFIYIIFINIFIIFFSDSLTLL